MAESKNSIISVFNHLNEYKPSSRQKHNITIRFPAFSLKCLLGVVQRTELSICLFRVFTVVCKKIRERNSFSVYSTSAFRKTADTEGSHYEFTGKSVNTEGSWLCAVKVQEQNQLQPDFFPPSTHDKIIYKWLI